jgi:hypothetical protein
LQIANCKLQIEQRLENTICNLQFAIVNLQFSFFLSVFCPC